eukprot:6211732-Pleurochrysis_carterae.AAC.3
MAPKSSRTTVIDGTPITSRSRCAASLSTGAAAPQAGSWGRWLYAMQDGGHVSSRALPRAACLAHDVPASSSSRVCRVCMRKTGAIAVRTGCGDRMRSTLNTAVAVAYSSM